MEHNIGNPFVPRASVVRYPNGIFELRLHLHGIASHVEVVPYDNYILVSGRLVPRVKNHCPGRMSSILWSDAVYGNFSRDIPLKLNPGTQILILERRQDCEDFVIRYTLRSSYIPRRNHTHLDQYSARPNCTYGYHAGNHGPYAKGAACTCGNTHVSVLTLNGEDSNASGYTNQAGMVPQALSNAETQVPVTEVTQPVAHNVEGFAVQQEV